MIHYEMSAAISEAIRQLNAANNDFDLYLRDHPQRDEVQVSELRKKIKLLRLNLDELKELQATNARSKLPIKEEILHVKALQRIPADEGALGRKPCSTSNRRRSPAKR